MRDFEMDKMYPITGREFLALLSLIPQGDEGAKAVLESVANRAEKEDPWSSGYVYVDICTCLCQVRSGHGPNESRR